MFTRVFNTIQQKSYTMKVTVDFRKPLSNQTGLTKSFDSYGTDGQNMMSAYNMALKSDELAALEPSVLE